MDSMYPLLSALENRSLPAVLATIVRVDGSSYRKTGTSALFMEDGTQIGVLSAGCVDADVAARVPDILERGVSQRVVYDLRTEDDLSWGKGPGCNGTVHMLLEPVHPQFRHDLLRAKSHLDQRRQVSLIRKLSAEDTGTTYGAVTEYAFVIDFKHRFGPWRGAIPAGVQAWCSRVPPFVQDGSFMQEGSIVQDGSPIQDGSSDVRSGDFESVFAQRLWPKARLALFGAGPDARPLAAIAAQTGFAVSVCDSREAYATSDYFPDADGLHVGDPVNLVNHLRLGQFDAVVVMTHSFATDRALLKRLLQTELLYLGVLGQRERTERLLPGREVPCWLHTPVGLSIHAEGPHEIAISIVADLIHVIRTNPQTGQGRSWDQL